MPGAFQTNALEVANSYNPPSSHPAYANPNLPSVIARKGLTNQGEDVNKAVNVIKKIGEVAEPPLHLPLGKDAVAMYENKMDLMKKDLEETRAEWAKYLELND